MRSARRISSRDRVARLSYQTVRRLGIVTKSVRDGFRGVGRFIQGAPKKVLTKSSTRKRTPQEGQQRLAREVIRSIVIEELARMRVAEGKTTPPQLDQRLRLMSAAIQALQKRIDELGTGGSIISEAVMWKELGTLEAAESLTNEERTLLVNVFKQNIAIQKPGLAKDGGGGTADRP